MIHHTRPEFAERIIEKYMSSQSNVFVVYGNTKDIYPTESKKYVPLKEFLIEALIKPERPESPKIVLVYDPVSGITFPNSLDQILLSREIGEDRLAKVLRSSKTDIVAACEVMREFTKLDVMVPRIDDLTKKIRKDFAIILNYGEAIAPPGSGDMMSDHERLKIITLENWFSDNRFVSSPDLVILVSETLTGINSRIVDLPYCSTILIDRPKEHERLTYIEHLTQSEKMAESIPASKIAFSSAGLSLLSIRQIFLQASYKGLDITPELVFQKTKEIIEKELQGHIEFPSIDYGFEKVIGASRLLKKLNELKTCVLSSDPEVIPVGILVPGANGVGKTFIYRAFAKECGWVAVVLKNIRDPYVGQTERNWERIRSVLEAMGNVMVMYDEADTEIGGRGSQTHDVDRRLFGNILRMMSEPKNRGKIIWIIITARPDRLEPDINRSGRAGEHLPVFDLEGEEKKIFVEHVLSQVSVRLNDFTDEEQDDFSQLTKEYFPADFDQLLTELRRRRLLEGKLLPAHVLEEIKDFIPSDLAHQRLYQELLAVLECTSLELIPDRYVNISRTEIQRLVQEIKFNPVAMQ